MAYCRSLPQEEEEEEEAKLTKYCIPQWLTTLTAVNLLRVPLSSY